jgi:hypothetical protein
MSASATRSPSGVPRLLEQWRPTATALLLANLIPLAGVLAFDWDVFALVFLFWLENVVVGGFNVLRMFWVQRGAERTPLAKVVVIPFFCFHYGMFTAVHGVFVFALFGSGFSGDLFPSAQMVMQVIHEHALWVAVGALVLSHAFSFVRNYVSEGEYRRVTLQQLMSQPYARVVVLHIAIIGGGFLVMALGAPVLGLLLLVVLKVAVDVSAHLREHAKLAPVEGG